MGAKSDKLSVLDAAVVVVGIVFGSGIFVAPQVVAQACGSVALSLLAWPVGAAIAVCGSVCYAECISRIRAEGGFYSVFRHTFGEAFATAAGLTAQLVISPATLAGPVTIGGATLAAALHRGTAPAGWSLAFSLTLLFLAAALNVAGVHFSKVTQRLFVATKVSLVASLVVACLWSEAGATPAAATPAPLELPFAAPQGFALLAAFFGVLLWTFDGWTDVTMISPRLRRPGRDLSRALILGLFGLAAIFVAVQYAIMRILGPEATAACPQPFSAAIAAVFGPRSQGVVDAAIVLSTFTSAHGVMWMVSSLTRVMAEQGALPRALAQTDARLGRPVACVGFVAALGAVACLMGDFSTIVALFSFFIWVFYGLMAASLVMLRRRKVAAEGTWVAPFGPLAPAVVGLVAVLMTVSHVVAYPVACSGAAVGFAALVALQHARQPKAGEAARVHAGNQ